MRELVLVIAAVLPLVACDRTNTAGPSSSTAIDALVRGLQQQGVTTSSGGGEPRDAFPFFSVQAKRLVANGDDVHVFEYASAAAATSDAAKVPAAGTPIGTTQITWIAPPRFYRKDQLIVLYVGSKADVVRALEAVLGKPFAGA